MFIISCSKCKSNNVYVSLDYNLSCGTLTAICNDCDHRIDAETENIITVNGQINNQEL